MSSEARSLLWDRGPRSWSPELYRMRGPRTEKACAHELRVWRAMSEAAGRPLVRTHLGQQPALITRLKTIQHCQVAAKTRVPVYRWSLGRAREFGAELRTHVGSAEWPAVSYIGLFVDHPTHRWLISVEYIAQELPACIRDNEAALMAVCMSG